MKHEELMKIETLDKLIVEMKRKNLTLPSLESSVVKKFKPLSVNQIYQLLKQCGASLGYELDNENLYYLMNDSRVNLVLATAGAGKTFSICVKILRSILLQGKNPNKVCVLSFSKKSVEDIKLRIESTMRGFNMVCRRFDIYLDNSEIPNVRSLNSLTYSIVDQFSDKFGIANLKIADDIMVREVMSQVIKSCEKDTGKFRATDNMVPDIVSLYNLLNETLEDVEDYAEHSYIKGNNLTVDLVKRMIGSFKSLMKIKGLVTHSDTGKMILDLAEVDEDFKKQLSVFYDLVVVDEIQDVSEATFRIIKLLVGDKNELWGVGDGDQSIYKFKGSRSDNCELFAQEYSDAVLSHLTLNRRCGDNILEMGRIILENTPNRKGVMPRALKKGGRVTHHIYSNKITPLENLVLKLSKEDKGKLGDYCISFRKNFSAFYIVNMLLEVGIPFQIRDDFRPGEDLFSRSIGDALALMRSPSNVNLISRTLFKISGISKQPPLEMVNKVLGKNYKRNDLYNNDIVGRYYEECMELEDCYYFYELPEKYFSVRQNNLDFDRQMKELEELSGEVRRGVMLTQLTPKIKRILDKNYWNFTKKHVNFPEELEEMVLKDLTREMTYVEYKHMKGDQEERIKRYITKGMGVQLSTMHALKGLEFREVHLIELDSTNMPMINNSGSDQEILEDLCEEMRLLYVAVTRAKESLHMYWSSVEPSPFMPMVNEYNDRMKQVLVEAKEKDLVLEVPGFNAVSDKIELDFKEYKEEYKEEEFEVGTGLELEQVDSEFELELELELDEKILNGELSTGEEDLKDEESEITEIENVDLYLGSEDDVDVKDVDGGDLILEYGEEILGFDEDLINNGELDLSIDNSNTVEEHTDKKEVESIDKINNNANQKNTKERVSKLLTKILTEKEISTLPKYNVEDIMEEELERLHPRDDFVEIKEGEALRNILGLICKDIM